MTSLIGCGLDLGPRIPHDLSTIRNPLGRMVGYPEKWLRMVDAGLGIARPTRTSMVTSPPLCKSQLDVLRRSFLIDSSPQIELIRVQQHFSISSNNRP